MRKAIIFYAILIVSGLVLASDSNVPHVNFDGIWDDMQISLITGTVGILNPPVLTQFRNTTYLYKFQDKITNQEQDMILSLQMSHSYKLNSDIHCHLHYTCGTTSANNVAWAIEVTKSDIGGAFPATQTLYVTKSCGTAYEHRLINFGSIGSFDDLSGIAVFRLYRNSGNATDTYTGDDVFGISFDCHYQKDSQGSRLEYIK